MQRVQAGLLLMAISGPLAALGAEPMVGGTTYRLRIEHDSKLDDSRRGPSTSLRSVAYDFRSARRGNRVELAIDRSTWESWPNGQFASRTETTRAGTVRQANGKVTVIDRARAKPEEVANFDQMEAPLVVLTLDAEGGEVGREMKAEPGYAGFVDLLRTFSPRFPRDRAEWDVEPDFLRTPDRKTEGTLHYVKRPATKGSGPIEVDISGKLIITGRYGPDEIKKAHQDVTGAQTFDPSLGEWVAGKLTILTEIDAATPQGETRTERTATVMTLSRREGAPEKAKESP